MLKNIVIIVFLLLSTACSSPEKSYSAAPLGGRVIDKETNKPIEGAYVVAVYVLDIGMEGGSRTPLHYEETTTDHEGRFHFSGFEKKKIPYKRASSNAILSNNDPRIYVFAKGYLPSSFFRRINSRIDKLSHRVSPLDSRDFRLQPSNDISIIQKSDNLYSYVRDLAIGINSTASPATLKSVECAFNHIPMTLAYIQSELKEYKKSGVAYATFEIPQPSHCTNRNK